MMIAMTLSIALCGPFEVAAGFVVSPGFPVVRPAVIGPPAPPRIGGYSGEVVEPMVLPMRWFLLTNEPGVEGYGRLDPAGHVVDITARRWVTPSPARTVPVTLPYPPAALRYSWPGYVFTTGSCASGNCARR